MTGKNRVPAVAEKVAGAVKANGAAHPAIEGEVVSLPKITPAQQRFVAHYAIFANGAAAVRAAKYSVTAHKEKAFELLTDPNVQAHIAHVRAALGELHFDLSNQIIRQLDRMRTADVTEFYDDQGNLKDPKLWPEDLKLLVNGIEIEEETRGQGEAAYVVRTKKVRLESRKGVMDTLAKILGVLKGGAGEGGDGDYADPRPKFPTAVVFNISVGEPKR